MRGPGRSATTRAPGSLRSSTAGIYCGQAAGVGIPKPPLGPKAPKPVQLVGAAVCVSAVRFASSFRVAL